MARLKFYLPGLFLVLALSAGCGKSDDATPSSAVAEKQNPHQMPCGASQCDPGHQYCLSTQSSTAGATNACANFPAGAAASCDSLTADAAKQLYVLNETVCRTTVCTITNQVQFTVTCTH